MIEDKSTERRIYHPILDVMTGLSRPPTAMPNLAYATHYKSFQVEEYDPGRPLSRLPGSKYSVSYRVEHVPGVVPCTIIRSHLIQMSGDLAPAPVQAELPEEFRSFAQKWDAWFEENTGHCVRQLHYNPEDGVNGGGSLTLILTKEG